MITKQKFKRVRELMERLIAKKAPLPVEPCSIPAGFDRAKYEAECGDRWLAERLRRMHSGEDWR